MITHGCYRKDVTLPDEEVGEFPSWFQYTEVGEPGGHISDCIRIWCVLNFSANFNLAIHSYSSQRKNIAYFYISKKLISSVLLESLYFDMALSFTIAVWNIWNFVESTESVEFVE